MTGAAGGRTLPWLVVAALAAGAGATALLTRGGDVDGGRYANCDAVRSHAEQSGGHVLADQAPPVPYNSTPGTSGWHTAGRPRIGIYTEPLSEPQIVGALEVGQVVIAYAPDLDRERIDAIVRLAEAQRGRITVTPFAGDMGAPIVLNAWAKQQRCTDVDEAAIERFVERHAREVPHALAAAGPHRGA